MKILITGANTGIGFATAEQLVKQGQHVILACRNPQKAQEAQNKLRSLDQGQVDVVSLDLNSLELTQKLPKKLQINMAALMYLLIMPVYFQKQSNSR